MPSFNSVFLMGNLTRDPELRQLPSGSSVCKFGLAINRRFTTAQGEEREETCFVEVETWGRQAETCARYLTKGRPVMIEGRLQQDQWQDASTGESRSRLLVHASQVQFLGSPPQQGGPGNSPQRNNQRKETSFRSSPGAGNAAPQSGDDEPDMPDFEPVRESGDNIPF